jgi:hypothetical protein
VIPIHFAIDFTELKGKVLLLIFALNLLPNSPMNFLPIVEKVANLQWFYTSPTGKS